MILWRVDPQLAAHERIFSVGDSLGLKDKIENEEDVGSKGAAPTAKGLVLLNDTAPIVQSICRGGRYLVHISHKDSYSLHRRIRSYFFNLNYSTYSILLKQE